MLTNQALVDLLDPVLTPMGLRVLSATWRASVLDLRLEHLDASAPSLDEIAGASKSISGVLDDAEGLHDSAFTLEVSSPGVERPLIRLAHFVWAIGRDIRFTSPEGVVEGRLARVIDDADPLIEVFVNSEVRTYSLRDVGDAKTIFEWGTKSSRNDGRRQIDGA
ncbi:MAG: hypothetical protein ACYCWN_00515 [Ferrimicrobium sp.]|jgi:ribosome maturation factor RimP|uniref:Ribosome maturation factor RimP n=1 Tax=Ferrimicrobium acidiphilum TaxID=121039 RepID=A0ABV3Y168_9ACTN|nr:hypothetical protein [Ferrimicrobium sp.]